METYRSPRTAATESMPDADFTPRHDPSASSFDAIKHNQFRRFSIGKCRSSYLGSTPFLSGTIHTCKKCTGFSSEALNSLCIIPAPALIRCTSPAMITLRFSTL